MWQRIQTVCMAVTVMALLGAPFFTVWQKDNASTQENAKLTLISLNYTKDKVVQKSNSTVYLVGMAMTAALLSAYSITQYKNRLKQIKLNFVSTLIMVSMLAISVYWLFEGEKFFQNPAIGQMGLGFYMPVIGLLSNSIANRLIHRDEKLVNSTNRLR